MLLESIKVVYAIARYNYSCLDAEKRLYMLLESIVAVYATGKYTYS